MNVFDVHVGLLRSRIENLSDSEERGRLIRLVDDLASVSRVVSWSERWPKTLARHGITREHTERAKWVRDRLDEEIAGRIVRAESARESA